MTRLSVNINKIATLRNARGGNNPDVLKAALDCERFGAEGITVHPRPDERHIRRSDVFALKPMLKTEFNIEGNPTKEFLDLVLQEKPVQVNRWHLIFSVSMKTARLPNTGIIWQQKQSRIPLAEHRLMARWS